MTDPAASARRTIRLERPLDLEATLQPLYRGGGDPTMRLGPRSAARASLTPDGPAAIAIAIEGDEVRAEAWGPGGDRLLEWLPAFLGLDDDDAGFDPALHPVVADLARRRKGIRLGRTGTVFDVLVPAILEQKVTGSEAFQNYRRLILRHGSEAPGPAGLRIPPPPAVIAGLPSWAFPPLGIEPRRGALLKRVAREGSRLEAMAASARRPGGGGAGAAELAARLRTFQGIGPWTAAEVTLRALGDPDAVSVGDAHLSNLVGWLLAREPRATDERMLALLEPWAGHRARVIRLLESSGVEAPRYGPRVAPRDLRDLAPRERGRRGG
jgi:3-methyladenine DNA glycosylase/8-oxoguanine DNA glycosylase